MVSMAQASPHPGGFLVGPGKKRPFTGHLVFRKKIRKKSSDVRGSTMLAAKEQAFIDLHTQHSAQVYRYIAYRIADRHRAEELAADVFRIAWEKQLSEPPGIGWLLATARNVLGNEYKGRRRRQELLERLQDEARSQLPGPDTEERSAVADVLVQLRERDREVLMLSYWDELPTAELAQVLGCSTSAAAVRLHRARRAFAKAAPSHLMNERKD
jgi:RNA polymerase sigma-70 factor (ECF subfamily)